MPESGQIDLGPPGLVSCTPVSDCQTANYKSDQASVTCLCVKSEAQQISATLVEEGVSGNVLARPVPIPSISLQHHFARKRPEHASNQRAVDSQESG